MSEFASIEYKRDSLIQLVREASFAARDAHEVIFEDIGNKHKELIAGLNLNKAISLMSAAKAIYISNYDDLCNADLEQIFHLFFVYESEFLRNISSGHSHQWTDIEYRKFKEYVDYFIG